MILGRYLLESRFRKGCRDVLLVLRGVHIPTKNIARTQQPRSQAIQGQFLPLSTVPITITVRTSIPSHIYTPKGILPVKAIL